MIIAEWTIGITGLVMVNVLIWVFLYGRGVGQMSAKIKNIEKKIGNPIILPECTELFTEIKEKLSHLSGNVETILLVMRENQRNFEKERTKDKL